MINLPSNLNLEGSVSNLTTKYDYRTNKILEGFLFFSLFFLLIYLLFIYLFVFGFSFLGLGETLSSQS